MIIIYITRWREIVQDSMCENTDTSFRTDVHSAWWEKTGMVYSLLCMIIIKWRNLPDSYGCCGNWRKMMHMTLMVQDLINCRHSQLSIKRGRKVEPASQVCDLCLVGTGVWSVLSRDTTPGLMFCSCHFEILSNFRTKESLFNLSFCTELHNLCS